MSFGPVEILVALLVIALLVGPSRVARMARSLGRGAYDFIDELGSDKTNKKDESSGELESGEETGDDRRD